jgi:Xaa-Pro dipeptidase
MPYEFDFPPEWAFSVEEYRARLDRVQALVRQRDLEALIVSGPENICYLSGWHTPGYYYPQFLVVPAAGDPVIVLRAMEAMGLTVRSWVPPERLVTFSDDQDPSEALHTALDALGLLGARVGLDREGWFLPVALYERIVGRCALVTFADGSWIVEEVRKVKSPAEIAQIEEACRLAEVGTQAFIDHFEVGMTEAALSGHVHRAMIEQGCEYVGLPVFLMSGHRMLAPHSVWSKDKHIVPGDHVLLELAGTVNRYAGALFRTFVVGDPSSTCLSNMAIAESMLDAAIAAARPGVTCEQVNQAVREVAATAGVTLRKRCGYSMGLNFAPDWGEGSFLEMGDGDTTVLEPGMVFHLPEVVRVPGEQLVAVSETVVITDSGCRSLTNFRRGVITL